MTKLNGLVHFLQEVPVASWLLFSENLTLSVDCRMVTSEKSTNFPELGLGFSEVQPGDVRRQCYIIQLYTV